MIGDSTTNQEGGGGGAATDGTQYYMMEDSNWFYSPVLGWQFYGEETEGGAWIFDPKNGWYWTNSEIYPWIYRSDVSGWTYDYSSQTGERIFYDNKSATFHRR